MNIISMVRFLYFLVILEFLWIIMLYFYLLYRFSSVTIPFQMTEETINSVNRTNIYEFTFEPWMLPFPEQANLPN